MLLYIKDELFNGKIVVNASLEDLYERLFRENTFSHMQIYQESLGQKIEEHIDEICENLNMKDLEKLDIYGFDMVDIKALLTGAGYSFFMSQGINGMRLVFISEKEIEDKATEIEKDLFDLRSCLSVDEYETILREQLSYHFNIRIKEEDIVFDRQKVISK